MDDVDSTVSSCCQNCIQTNSAKIGIGAEERGAGHITTECHTEYY